MTRALTSLDDLLAHGLIPAHASLEALKEVATRYSIAITPEIARALSPKELDSPIARQFLPDARELTQLSHESLDPIGDQTHSPVTGVVHRYADRVLLKLLTVCPVYCRFCFRRETVGRGKGDLLNKDEIDAALGYIAAHPEIHEIILTGGDPMMLSAPRIALVAEKISALSHIRVLRAHTRAPTAAPHLVTREWLDALKQSGKALYVVLHINHSQELTENARTAIERIRSAGIALFAQSVLLAGVNDDVTTLERLMRDLMAAQIKPYYLHHPDLAPGTAHFRLDLKKGQEIYRQLSQRLSGLSLPTYVLDLPGGFGKIPISAATAQEQGPGLWRILDRSGQQRLYQE
ncbi:MAG: lysine-2,3-aminomutase-like protein [Methylocystaceae bacterium]|jgi:lysine 2,3-aminomutase|nr:lysine-2,3-aminomutase-like protein [Methylocystaceae bacterium]